MYDIIDFNVREQFDDTKKGKQLQTHREISDKHFLIINWKLLWSITIFNLINRNNFTN